MKGVDVLHENQKYHYTIINSINSDGLYKPCISIYFNGCDKPVKCKDCQNKELQQAFVGNSGTIKDMKKEITRQVEIFKNFYGEDLRIAFVGGEPLTSYNRNAVLQISKFLKDKYICKTIIYSWRNIQDIKLQRLEKYLNYIDFGILGEFEKDLFVEDQIPASTNQYIYDFNKSEKIKPIKKGE